MIKTVQFSKGIQFSPKLGSLSLRVTNPGRLAYGQNVDSSKDEYGLGVIVPGPSLISIDNSSGLTGIPYVKAFYGSIGVGYLYFAQGILGAKNIIRRVKDILSGSTPSIDTTHVITLNHGPDHANQTVVDMVLRPDTTGTMWLYVAGKDDTDTWVNKIDANSGVLFTPENPAVVTNNQFTGGFTNQFLVLGADNVIYWIGKDRVSSIDTTDNYTVDALANKLPIGTYASAGADWQTNLVIACSSDAFGDFDRRLSAGSSEIIIWDYSNANVIKRIPVPCRYISVLKADPNGNLLVFGGVDEGKSTIYEFTGNGLNFLYSYIGDLPRSRHSVEFDSQGRIVWLTAEGQLCRYDKGTQIFDHLGTV